MNIGYIFKLWFSVILATPAFMLITYGINIEIWFYGVLLGLVLSFPALLVILLLALIIDNHIKDPITLKICYIVATLICMFITLSLAFGPKISFADGGFGDFMMWYAITIFLFGMIYKVKTVSAVPKEDDAA
jgi:hypothetical protein